MPEHKVIGGTATLEIQSFAPGEDETVPGLDWTLSQETKDAIQEIEDNIRTAEQKSGHILLE